MVGYNAALHRFGNLPPPGERCTMFIYGLEPAIKTSVARQREQKPKQTHLELLFVARANGNPFHAWNLDKGKITRATSNGLMTGRAGRFSLWLGMDKIVELYYDQMQMLYHICLSISTFRLRNCPWHQILLMVLVIRRMNLSSCTQETVVRLVAGLTTPY